jgi:hypothetical protein
MDLSLLVTFFKQLGFLHLPAPFYGSYLVARVIVGLFKTADFDLKRVKDLLVTLGVKVKETLVPILVDKAREGIESLAGWLRDKKEEVGVNEAAAQILVSQTGASGQALDEAALNEQQTAATAQKVKASLEGLGGAPAAIAEDYAEALMRPDMREVLMAKMAEGLHTWQMQSMEAKRHSIIAHSEQTMDSDMPAEQRMSADDNSAIVGSTQRIGPSRSQDP